MKKMNKLFTTVFFSVSAILASHSHVAYANQTKAYKCTSLTGKVIYQDFACASNQYAQVLLLETAGNKGAGLREQEIKALENLRERLKQERELRNRLSVAKLNRDASVNGKCNTTEVYVQHTLSNHAVTQNSVNIKR